jgi:hypothetical protein
MHDHLVAINDGLSTLSGRHFSIHVAVPFITSVARRRLQSIPKKGNIDIHLSSHQIVPTVKELLTPRTYQILSNSLFLQYLHDENDNGVALSYFDHKIPNSQSFLFAGGGWGADFMPCIKPPYCKK